MQYSIRNVPRAVDLALRARARREGRSLNEVALAALSEATGLSAEPLQRRSLEDIAGTWKKDRAFDAAIENQHQVDPDLWK